MRKSRVVIWIVIATILLWTLIPLYWYGKFAFQTKEEISSFPPRFYPENLSFEGFFNAIGFPYTDTSGRFYPPSGQGVQVFRGLINSFILACAVTVITIIIVVPLAYVFGRLQFRFKNALLFTILFSVTLPPVTVIIPFFIIFNKLGLFGTLRGLTIITLTITIPFVTWMMLGFFRNLPNVESLASIDGFSRFGTFIRIVVPMAKAGIAVGAIITFLFSWNEYTFAQILVNGTSATTLPASISGFLFQQPEPQYLAVAIIYSLIPAFISIYLLQRYITKMNIVDVIGG